MYRAMWLEEFTIDNNIKYMNLLTQELQLKLVLGHWLCGKSYSPSIRNYLTRCLNSGRINSGAKSKDYLSFLLYLLMKSINNILLLQNCEVKFLEAYGCQKN